jgi:KDO2-lipid IV(A) lauroyltransferase
MHPPRRDSFAAFWSPRYWPTWLALIAMRLSAALPLRPQIRAAKRMGNALSMLRRRSRAVAASNLKACFPELSDAQRAKLLTRHFESVGAALVEVALGWFGSPEKLRRVVTVRGAEHVVAAQQQGRGVILMAAHFTPLELAAAALPQISSNGACMYRRPHNAMIEAMMQRGRSRFARAQIPQDDVRGLLRLLKEGAAVIYAPDQTYVGSQAALLPFFGEMAMTNTATSKLARLTGAAVMTYFFRRLPDDASYVVDIAPVDAFPSDDARADTLRLVALLEHYIRGAPDQYLWIYKKFKGRPAPYPDLYGGAAG